METLSNFYYSNDKLKDIIAKSKDNQVCFDCGKTPCSFASINLGIFLCYSCSRFHKRLGSNISEIRSLFIDSWNEEQIKYLATGGNTRLNLLLELYNIDKKKTHRVILYNSKVIEYHRQTISSEVNHTNLPIMTEIGEALCLFNGADASLVNKIIDEQLNLGSILYKGQKMVEHIQEKIDATSKKLHEDTRVLVTDVVEGVKQKIYNAFHSIGNSASSLFMMIFRA